MNSRKNELINKLSNLLFNNSEVIYNSLILLDNDSKFDDYEFKKFIVIISYLLSGQNVEKNYLDKLLSNLDKIDVQKSKNIAERIEQINPGWYQFDSVQNLNSNLEFPFKIYLSVDNSTLHMFINDLMISTVDKNYNDLSFKINSNEDINRRDNVVIYCTKENLNEYIDLIKSVIETNPDIKFNAPHLLGIPVTEKISVGVDFDGGKVSFTEGICDNISKGLNNGKTPEDIVSILEMMQEKEKLNIENYMEKKQSESFNR